MHTHTYVHRYALNICYSLTTQLQNAYDKSKTDDKVTEYLYLYVCVCICVRWQDTLSFFTASQHIKRNVYDF